VQGRLRITQAIKLYESSLPAQQRRCLQHQQIAGIAHMVIQVENCFIVGRKYAKSQEKQTGSKRISNFLTGMAANNCLLLVAIVVNSIVTASGLAPFSWHRLGVRCPLRPKLGVIDKLKNRRFSQASILRAEGTLTSLADDHQFSERFSLIFSKTVLRAASFGFLAALLFESTRLFFHGSNEKLFTTCCF